MSGHDDDGLDAVVAWLRGADRIVLTGHAPLDGDGLGSALGLCRAMRLTGRRARVVTAAPVPSALRWLPGADDVLVWSTGAYEREPTLSDPQALVCFDSGDTTRLGGPFLERPPSMAV